MISYLPASQDSIYSYRGLTQMDREFDVFSWKFFKGSGSLGQVRIASIRAGFAESLLH
jgi:hypothetical protein